MAEPAAIVFTAPNELHVLPLSVDTWKVTVPVGVKPVTPEIVTDAVTEVPKLIGLIGFKVGAGTVGVSIKLKVVVLELPYESVTTTIFAPGVEDD